MREFKKNKVNEYSLQKKTLNLREREKLEKRTAWIWIHFLIFPGSRVKNLVKGSQQL